MKKTAVAIITARGGSKRIPHKNIKLFLGQPIIKYSIDAALQSKCFEEVMVSTDSQKIAKIARSFGAKVPFLRSIKNSNDYATTAGVIKEVLFEYKKRGKEFTYFCCIYPAAPFITPQKIRLAFKKMIDNKANAVVPVVRFSYPIQRALKIENNQLSWVYPENKKIRSQDLSPLYHDCGQFYLAITKTFIKQGTIMGNRAIPMEIPESEVQDIDNEEDWKLAEIKYKFLKKYSKLIL